MSSFPTPGPASPGSSLSAPQNCLQTLPAQSWLTPEAVPTSGTTAPVGGSGGTQGQWLHQGTCAKSLGELRPSFQSWGLAWCSMGTGAESPSPSTGWGPCSCLSCWPGLPTSWPDAVLCSYSYSFKGGERFGLPQVKAKCPKYKRLEPGERGGDASWGFHALSCLPSPPLPALPVFVGGCALLPSWCLHPSLTAPPRPCTSILILSPSFWHLVYFVYKLLMQMSKINYAE